MTMGRYDKNTGSMLPRLTVFLLLVLTVSMILGLSVAAASSVTRDTIYYIRLDQKIRNGTYVTDTLTMSPAEDDYRRLPFKRLSIQGRILTASVTDPMGAARNDAYERLLINQGTRSVRARTQTDRDGSLDESVVSYEGYVRIPHTVTAQGYSKDGATFTVEMNVEFAPMAYPTQWSFRSLKKKIGDALAYFLSFFH